MRMPLPRRLLLLAALLAAPTLGTGQEPLYRAKIRPKDVESRTDWYGVYLKAAKIGYVKSARERLADGALREAQTTRLKLLSFGQKAEITSEQEMVYEGQTPHRLVRGELTQSDGNVRQTTKVVRTDRGLEITHEVAGQRQTKTLEGAAYYLADALAAEGWIRRGPRDGDTISYRHLDLFDQKFDVQTSKVLSTKTSLAKGVEARIYEIETTSKNKGIKALSRHDDKGTMLSDQIAVFELRLEPEEKAKNARYSQDLFVMGMVKIDRPVGETKKVSELIVEVAGEEARALEDGPRQTVAAENGTVVIKVGKNHGRPVKATEKDVEENLAETSAYPIGNARIKALAEKAVGDAKTPEEKVKRIVSFVNDYVKPSLSANMPNVYDLMEHKKGDCKSYALLTTNLARAAGVPAREVSGLLYVGDDFKAFGGHAWNEVVLDGVWVPVDASMRETEVNATHISFGTEHRATANLLNTLGKLSFRLVEVRHGQ